MYVNIAQYYDTVKIGSHASAEKTNGNGAYPPLGSVSSAIHRQVNMTTRARNPF